VIDYEQLAQESAIWPWLDSDCMADNFLEEDFFTNQEIDEDENDSQG
jgi:hypothetical protein